MANPIYTRMFKVHEVYGVSEWTVRRWAKRKMITIYRRGTMSFVRHEDMVRILETPCGAS